MGKDLEYFKSLKYEVIVKSQGDHFVLYIPELPCFVKEKSLDAAYTQLELKKEKYFEGLIDMNLQHSIQLPSSDPEGKSLTNTFKNNYLPFLIKLFVIYFIVMGTILSSLIYFKIPILELKRTFREEAQALFTSSMPELKRTFREEAQALFTSSMPKLKRTFREEAQAFRQLPDERKQKMVNTWRKTLLAIKPFTDEFGVLLQEPNESASPSLSSSRELHDEK